MIFHSFLYVYQCLPEGKQTKTAPKLGWSFPPFRHLETDQSAVLCRRPGHTQMDGKLFQSAEYLNWGRNHDTTGRSIGAITSIRVIEAQIHLPVIGLVFFTCTETVGSF